MPSAIRSTLALAPIDLWALAGEGGFVAALIVAVIGSGLLGTLATLAAMRRHRRARVDRMAVAAAHEAAEIMRQDIIAPLRDQVDAQARQIRRLEARQAQYFTAVGYIRALCHWLDPAVTAMDPAYMADHPKPRLPDQLRDQVAPGAARGEGGSP